MDWAGSASITKRFRLLCPNPHEQRAQFADDVRTGLTATPKYLSCRYFYDQTGSALFDEICRLPEYYLTRAERSILVERSEELAAGFPNSITVVELGSGTAAKTRLLLEAFLRRHRTVRYVPVDICRTTLERTSLDLLKDYRGLVVEAIAGEYHDGLGWLNADGRHTKLVIWLGSNIGNLHRDEAAHFVHELTATMGPADRLLIGFDLRKNRALLERAYNDNRGVTARFNKNLLVRINRELGGNFDLDQFDHYARYEEEPGRIELYLVSRSAQQARIDRLNMEVACSAGERIHTENSYKYSTAEIDALALCSGLKTTRIWLDNERRFCVGLFART